VRNWNSSPFPQGGKGCGLVVFMLGGEPRFVPNSIIPFHMINPFPDLRKNCVAVISGASRGMAAWRPEWASSVIMPSIPN